MNYRLKICGRALSPPLLRRGLKALSDFVSKGRHEPGERDADWYDLAFSRTVEAHKHYTESEHYFLWSIIAYLMDRDEVQSVLDVGCGSGQFAGLLRDRGIRDYCGVDFSPKRVDWARASCPDLRFVVADALSTDLFETFPYDAVVCAEFLDHIQSDLEVVRRIRRGARFYGIVPNFPWRSHVRHFQSAGEVAGRYAQYFKNFRVSPFLANRAGKIYFLLEGIKI